MKKVTDIGYKEVGKVMAPLFKTRDSASPRECLLYALKSNLAPPLELVRIAIREGIIGLNEVPPKFWNTHKRGV